MQKTKIEWTDYTWNPIKGLCPNDCWYCYAKRMYQRFGWDPEVSLDGELFGSCQHAFNPNIKVYEMLERIKPGSKIFICSTFELFHSSIHKEWRDAIFKAIKEHPQHTFQILTKFPQNIDRAMPDNVHLGVSVSNSGGMIRHWRLRDIKAKVKFISMEPLLSDVLSLPNIRSCNWIVIGRLTGFGRKYDPKKEWIEKWVRWSKNHDIPIFLKSNLKDIWGESLIQEMPQIG